MATKKSQAVIRRYLVMCYNKDAQDEGSYRRIFGPMSSSEADAFMTAMSYINDSSVIPTKLGPDPIIPTDFIYQFGSIEDWGTGSTVEEEEKHNPWRR
jgi:hypothetical protein